MIINRVSSNLKTVLSVIDIWLSSWLTLLYGDLFHYCSQMFTTWHSSKNVCRWFARKLRKNEASSLEQRFGFQPCDGKNVRCPKKRIPSRRAATVSTKECVEHARGAYFEIGSSFRLQPLLRSSPPLASPKLQILFWLACVWSILLRLSHVYCLRLKPCCFSSLSLSFWVSSFCPCRVVLFF